MPTNPNPTLVSVITPVYNGAKYLDELILSVNAQDYPHIEHLVIDDGSNDEGATIDVLEHYPHLRWWSRENRGQYATMNEGLDAAQGELVIFISADDLMARNAVKQAVEYLQENPEKDGVYGDYEFMNVSGVPLRPFRPMRNAPTWMYPYSFHISHSSLFLRKRVLISRGLYFNAVWQYAGDYDWIVRTLFSGLQIGRISQSLSTIRQHEEQASNKSFFKMRDETLNVQNQLGVSAFWASFFRKILFFARMLTLARDKGVRSALDLLRERL